MALGWAPIVLLGIACFAALCVTEEERLLAPPGFHPSKLQSKECSDKFMWPGGIHYQLSGTIPDFAKLAIRKSANFISDQTCFKFRQVFGYTNSESYRFILFVEWSDSGNCSFNRQLNTVFVSGQKCIEDPPTGYQRELVKLLLKAIGFENESSRTDRDDYIKLNHLAGPDSPIRDAHFKKEWRLCRRRSLNEAVDEDYFYETWLQPASELVFQVRDFTVSATLATPLEGITNITVIRRPEMPPGRDFRRLAKLNKCQQDGCYYGRTNYELGDWLRQDTLECPEGFRRIGSTMQLCQSNRWSGTGQENPCVRMVVPPEKLSRAFKLYHRYQYEEMKLPRVWSLLNTTDFESPVLNDLKIVGWQRTKAKMAPLGLHGDISTGHPEGSVAFRDAKNGPVNRYGKNFIEVGKFSQLERLLTFNERGEPPVCISFYYYVDRAEDKEAEAALELYLEDETASEEMLLFTTRRDTSQYLKRGSDEPNAWHRAKVLYIRRSSVHYDSANMDPSWGNAKMSFRLRTNAFHYDNSTTELFAVDQLMMIVGEEAFRC